MRVALASTMCVPWRIPLKPSYIRSAYLYQQRPHSLPLRYVTYVNHLRQKARGEVHIRSLQSESIKPESYQEPSKAKPIEAPKTDALLAEQTVSNREQRRADWIIVKEMAKYIWPKVWPACNFVPANA